MRYMPVLRVKSSEYLSLGTLTPDVADVIEPLMFVSPALDDDADAATQRRIELFSRQWQRPAFFDPTLAVTHEGLDAGGLYDQAATLGPYAPAAPLDPGFAAAAAPAAEEHGRAALRVSDPYAVLDPHIQRRAEEWLEGVGLTPEAVTLVFDLGASDDARAAGAVLRFPFADRWAAVVLTGGAFAPMTTPGEHFIPRTHLTNWREVSASAGRDLVFGDYGTLGAEYQPPAPFPAAAKLVYTEPEGWFYARGRSISTEGNEQMFDIAATVAARNYWRGRDYSWGDEWIDDRARGTGNPGNAAMWIRAALTHHMTHVVREDL